MAATIHCEAEVTSVGDRLIVRLPDEASAELPSRGQVAVTAVLNGRTFGTVLEPDGLKGHWLAVGETTRRALKLRDGDAVTLDIEPSKDWPEPELPEDFRAVLADASDILDVWDDITPMARWEWVRWINATKNPQTRERRIDVSVSKLRSGKRRPCCFDLSSCTDPDLSKNGKLLTA